MGKRTVSSSQHKSDGRVLRICKQEQDLLLDEPSGISIDGVKEKSLHGALSPLYGTTYEDEHAFTERYRCGCTGDAGLRVNCMRVKLALFVVRLPTDFYSGSILYLTCDGNDNNILASPQSARQSTAQKGAILPGFRTPIPLDQGHSRGQQSVTQGRSHR